jgi:mannose-6-phosphate isomerase-like protein (cupin superfamily)
MHAFGVREAQERLAAAGGGYEVVHAAPGLEVGVYILVAPEPDSQTPHEDDEVYLVLAGSGALDVGGKEVPLSEGDAVFVEAGVAHRFGGYETLSLLVVFTPPAAEATPLKDPTS